MFVKNQNDIFLHLWDTVSHALFSSFSRKSRKKSGQKLTKKIKNFRLVENENILLVTYYDKNRECDDGSAYDDNNTSHTTKRKDKN